MDSIAVSQTRSEEPLPSGRLNAPDQAEVSKVFFAPSTVNAVEFLCLNRVAPVCRFVCKTKSGQQGFGYLGINKKLRAMLAASNTRAYVYFQTTDPFGGTCSWKSYYQGIDCLVVSCVYASSALRSTSRILPLEKRTARAG